ncbi:MAG: hypothetical protein OEL79_02870 [Chromatiales bacterium]|nr:hypothetical protein [Chromatiales bacterium]
MRDKVLLNVQIILITLFSLLFSGCAMDGSFKQPAKNQPIVTSKMKGELPLQCSDKKIALLHIEFEHPEQSQYFPELQKLITKRLLKKSYLNRTLHFRDASNISLQPQHLSLLGTANRGEKEQIHEIGKQFDSQIVVSGSITNIEPSQNFEPDQNSESLLPDNVSGVIHNITDKLSAISWLKVSFKLRIFDSYSGELINEIETVQKVSLKSGKPFFILGAPSERQKYEKGAIDTLANQQVKIINDATFCTFLKGRIISTDNVSASIDVGSHSQVRVGDQFKLINARLLRTDEDGVEHFAEDSVGMLTITQVKAGASIGTIEYNSRVGVLKAGDYVINQ